MTKASMFLRIVLPVIACLMLAGMVGGAAKAASARPATVTHPQTASSSGFLAHPVQVKPITKSLGKLQDTKLKHAQGTSAGKVLYACQNDTNPLPFLCYGPGQIRQAYGVQQLADKHITGQGSRIVIVDAFGSSTIQQDLQAFDADWGLPDPTLNILNPFGSAVGSDFGWAVETSLDVEYAHVMAPGAVITLVVAQTNSDVDIYNAIKYAVDNNLGDVLSMSFGENESCVDPNLLAAEHQVFQEATRKGITLLASAGDFGSAQFTCDGSSFVTAVSSPASDPLVTAVGGTALTADAVTGTYIGETAWNESAAFNNATGGGYSVLYPRPAYQTGRTGDTPGRGLPDLSMNASIVGGVLVYLSDPFSGQENVFLVGGTSVGAPELAGIIADGVQLAHHSLGFLNTALYALGSSGDASHALHDITSGNNILFSSGIAGYMVQAGWDAVTGWGTPANGFLAMLLDRLHAGDANGL